MWARVRADYKNGAHTVTIPPNEKTRGGTLEYRLIESGVLRAEIESAEGVILRTRLNRAPMP